MRPEPPLLLLTRPASDARRFAASIRAPCAWRAVISPLLEIVPLGGAEDPGGVPLFTSAAAVPFAGAGRGRLAWCVGPRTAGAARRAGWDAREGGGDGAALLGAIRAAGGQGPFVHLRGAHARVPLAEGLRAAGFEAAERVVYDQRATPLTPEARAALSGAARVVAPLFSPRTAELFSDGAGEVAAALTVIALSEAVAAGAARFAPRVAARPDGAAMAEAAAAALCEGGGARDDTPRP